MNNQQKALNTIKNNGYFEVKVVCPSCQHATLLYPQGYLPKLESVLPKKKTEKDFSTYSYNTTYAMMEGYNQAIADCTKALMDSKVFATEPEYHCKWEHISHGIGLDNKVTEVKVHCEINPENDYTEYFEVKTP